MVVDSDADVSPVYLRDEFDPVIMLVRLGIYDLVTIRRPHRVTFFAGLGTPAVFLLVISLPFVNHGADVLIDAVLAAQP